jgi:uncharacterized membrane protein YjgN (DUF898 family)
MYLGSQSLFGEPLEYTGTGKELFLGFLIVFAVLITVGIIINVGNFYIQTMGSNAALIAFKTFYYLDFFNLFGYAVYRARRYQLSRSVWRASGLYKPAMQKIRDEMPTHSYRAHVVAAGAY